MKNITCYKYYVQIKLLKEYSFTHKFSPTKFLGKRNSELLRISLPLVLILLTRVLGEYVQAKCNPVFLKIQPVSPPPQK